MLIALSVVVALIAGIAFSQLASAQANAVRGLGGQVSQSGYNSYNQVPQQGYYPNGGSQYGSPQGYGCGMGMGMRGHFW